MKNFIIGIILSIIVVIICSIIVAKSVKDIAKDYEKPDTTITIHNGKSDTLITKKHAPSWLK